MDDDQRSEEPLATRPLNEEESEGEEEPRHRPVSRLDRLMGAKDRTEKEAARWDEIEEKGQPVPSADRPLPGATQPVIEEPPRQPGNTPAGQGTPSKGLPPVQAEKAPPPEAEGKPASARRAAARRGLPPPPFPHPTDRPPVSPPVPPVVPTVSPPLEEEGETPAGEGTRPQPSQGPRPVRLDEDGMPLPQRVPYEDGDATIVGTSAYRDELPGDVTQPHAYERPDLEVTQPAPPSYAPMPPPVTPAPPPPVRPAPPRRRPARAARRPRPLPRISMGCIGRIILLLFISGLVALMLGSGLIAMYYAQVTAPSFRGIYSVADLRARALQFETTRIRDREGNVLYEINDPQGGFRDYVTLDEVSPWVIVATVATEERGYFTNPGFSIPAIARALYQNLRQGEVVSGASTITQQLTRALLLPEEERAERTYERKIKEIFLAAELGRRFSKRDILELYLNQIYYGNLAYGIEAAAQTYFGKSARDLNLAEASFLAGLPQAPAIYDPVNNKEGALQRQQQVLMLMLEAGCLDTGNTGLALPCTTDVEIAAAQADLVAVATREYHAPAIQAKYPHWVVYVQQLLEADPDIGPAIYTSGFDVYTTLDPRLQDAAQQQVETVLAGLADRNVHNASVVVIDVHSGAILAMVGSRDFNDESIDGQVNIALTPQQPGSSIKPFTYLAAFRKGWTPATVIWDVPIQYEIPGFGIYAPVNYDGEFRGPVTVREAIANSLNVPAVQALDYVGVPALLQVLNDVGITSLGDPSNPYQFGLSLTLGAGDVYLLEWTNAFATIANGGVYRPPYAIERIERDGQIVRGPYQVPPGQQVIDPGHAYLMQHILSDKVARIPEFGENSPISPPYPAGAKTGTTTDFRDNWTMGFTTEVAVGVWVGNTDNSPMINVTGVTGAGPIWRGVMDAAAQWYPPREFPMPPGVFPQTVCADDGALPSEYCLQHSRTRTELFVSDPPGPNEGLYRLLRVDTFSGLIANQYCEDYVEERLYLALPNPSQLIDVRPFIVNWLLNTDAGRAWAAERGITPEFIAQAPPEQSCGPDTPRPTIAIDQPQEGSVQGNIVTVWGTVDAPNFSHYRVEFGVSHDPIGWGVVQGDTSQIIHGGVLGQVDLSAYEDGPMTIRVIVYDTQGHSAEKRVHFMLVKPTPTPPPTPTITLTPTVKPTKTPEPTVAPTETPSGAEPTPTETPGAITTP